MTISIKLKRPEGYNTEEGAKFDVEFTKGRSVFGSGAKPFRLHLQKTENGLTWTVESNIMTKDKQIIDMIKEGTKQKDIAERLSCTPSYVTQVKKRAEQQGKLDDKDKTDEKDRGLPESEEEQGNE